MNYRKEMLRTCKTPSSPSFPRLLNAAMGLCGESGEFIEHVKKALFQDKDLNLEEAILELGDIRWYLELAACSLGVTMKEVERRNIAKLKKRHKSIK